MISIDTEKLQLIIQGFTLAKVDLENLSMELPSKSGGGQSIDLLANLDGEYMELKNAVILLMEKTISFMQSLSNDADVLDSSIAKNMNLGE